MLYESSKKIKTSMAGKYRRKREPCDRHHPLESLLVHQFPQLKTLRLYFCLLLANLVTTSKALVTTSVAPVTTLFLAPETKEKRVESADGMTGGPSGADAQQRGVYAQVVSKFMVTDTRMSTVFGTKWVAKWWVNPNFGGILKWWSRRHLD